MSRPPRKLLFLTGTRADFGKMKPLIKAVDGAGDFDCSVFVTGMHTLDFYGMTLDEVRRCGFKNIHVYMNQFLNEPMDLVLANTIAGLSRFVHEDRPDMIIVHGDRIEAMAGAVVGALRNTLVGHIEGGELSGTVDELIRHAVSKLSHLHFVANQEAANRLRQLGEMEDSVFVIGSPDIDVMTSETLPAIGEVKRYYEIPFERYSIAIFHPVTTELDTLAASIRAFVSALIASGNQYVVVYPNNDEGTTIISEEYKRLAGNRNFRVFPSIRFEYFVSLLKNADCIVGNSSAGIREAPFYGLPTVNVGSRQARRYRHESIIDVPYDTEAILAGIARARGMDRFPPSRHFGEGDSVGRFMAVLRDDKVWQVSRQKQFNDLALPLRGLAGGEPALR